MAETKRGALELVVRQKDGFTDYAILVDGVEVGTHCTKLVVTVTPDGKPRAELTLLVEDVTIPKTDANVTYYRACANCQREMAAEPEASAPPAGPH